MNMDKRLIDIEKDLCGASSIISLARRADSAEQAIEIDDTLQLAEEMIDNARQELTNIIILMQRKKAEVV